MSELQHVAVLSWENRSGWELNSLLSSPKTSISKKIQQDDKTKIYLYNKNYFLKALRTGAGNFDLF